MAGLFVELVSAGICCLTGEGDWDSPATRTGIRDWLLLSEIESLRSRKKNMVSKTTLEDITSNGKF